MDGVNKVCLFCEVDLSQKHRTKDKAGNYYCDSCWIKHLNAARLDGPSRLSQDEVPPAGKSSWIESAWDGTGAWLTDLPSRMGGYFSGRRLARQRKLAENAAAAALA